ncbi:MAG: hypothetical protein WAV07_15475 [Candidatus Contendobacter sp.]
MTLPPLPKPSWLSRLGLAVTSALVVVAGFAIASLLLTILLVAGLAVGGWLWWQFRRLARRAQSTAPGVIEGEYTVVPEYLALEDQQASSNPLSAPPPHHRATTRKNRRASRSHR